MRSGHFCKIQTCDPRKSEEIFMLHIMYQMRDSAGLESFLMASVHFSSCCELMSSCQCCTFRLQYRKMWASITLLFPIPVSKLFPSSFPHLLSAPLPPGDTHRLPFSSLSPLILYVGQIAVLNVNFPHAYQSRQKYGDTGTEWEIKSNTYSHFKSLAGVCASWCDPAEAAAIYWGDENSSSTVMKECEGGRVLKGRWVYIYWGHSGAP